MFWALIALMRTILVLCSGLFLAGCMLRSASREEHLRDVVYEYNDALRWGATGVARRHVAPSYRKLFETRHANWGRERVIADSAVGGVAVDEDSSGAISTVEIVWYEQASTDLKTTVVEQRWEPERGHYHLVAEKTLHGEAALLDTSNHQTTGP